MTANSDFTISGGTLSVNGAFGGQKFYTGTIGTMTFNGGIVTASTLLSSTKSASPVYFVFGGGSAGSLAVFSFDGTAANRSMDWLTGTKMTVTVTTADEWAEAEWNAGRLTYNGADYTTLGTWVAVTAANGLGTGANFEYDSATETLSLISPDVTPPSARLTAATAGSGQPAPAQMPGSATAPNPVW